MIRVLTIDDEPLALKLLDLYLGRIPDFELVSACPDAAAAGRVLAREAIDCIFVDINMPDMSGLDFVRQLENPPVVVFTTAYAEYAIEGFKVNAADYLLKPFSFDEFKEATDKVRMLLQLRSLQKSNADDMVFFFKSGSQKIRVLASEILYFESIGAYLKVYTTNYDPFTVLGSLKGMLESNPDQFFRIHKTYVVNLDHVRSFGKTGLVMDNAKSLPVGETYSQAFVSRMEK